MPFWDERFKAMAAQYRRRDAPTQYHIDILSAHFVQRPQIFDVVVGSNLFGDILSDLGPAVCGTIGIAPSANINPERTFPSLFEPVHGSAPDIAGQGIANPIGQIWSGAMMLEFLGHKEAAARSSRRSSACSPTRRRRARATSAARRRRPRPAQSDRRCDLIALSRRRGSPAPGFVAAMTRGERSASEHRSAAGELPC